MDLRTEQAYQQRIAELEVCVVDLTAQLAQRDATIVALQQQVAVLSEQVAELLEQVARLSKNSSNSSKPPSPGAPGSNPRLRLFHRVKSEPLVARRVIPATNPDGHRDSPPNRSTELWITDWSIARTAAG